MPIIHCSDQKGMTLEEFYSKFVPDKNQFWAEVGTGMLSVLKLVNETFKETTIYGLTSHSTLLFLSKDSYKKPWFVSISRINHVFLIEYRMTIKKEPWPDAIVQGSAKSLEELKKLIIIAMTESEGWMGSEELKQFYKQIKEKE